MAGFERFNKRWAENGQTEVITDNNANLGLVFLGDDPPTAELHNQMFQWLDEKDNYLFNLLNEVIKERVGGTGLSAAPVTQLADAIATLATTTKAGIQRNATGAETSAMSLANRTVTPASLKPLIDGLTLGLANSVPSGAVVSFARSSPPAGWLVADGAAVSRSQYIELFNALGTAFGAGNGSTTFNLPNLNGAVVRGWNGSSSGVDSGRAFGSIQQPQNQAHSHGASVTVAGAHSHSVSTTSAGSHSHSMSINSAGSHRHAIYNNGDRSSGAMGNRVYGDENDYGTLTSYTSYDGVHTHTGQMSNAGSHSHSGSTSSEGSHNHGITINAEGGENRMYNIALLYCIKI